MTITNVELWEAVDDLRDRFSPSLSDDVIAKLLPDELRAAFVARRLPPKTLRPVGSRSAPSRATKRRDVPRGVELAVLGEADACHYCSDVLLPRQVEHVRPLSRGGTNDRSNLVAACIACNSQKRAMMVHEWRQWRESNGMHWPPVASHATDPRHYRGVCRDCRRAGGPEATHRWRVVPYRMDIGANGYRIHHQCPVGHFWTRGQAFDTTYFSDCPCSYCVTCCLEDGVEADPPMTFMEVGA